VFALAVGADERIVRGVPHRTRNDMQTPALSTVPLRESRGELFKHTRTGTRALRGEFAETADHELVQRRLALTYGLCAALLAGVFALGMVTTAVLAPRLVSVFDPAQLTYVAGIAVMVAAWRICRGRLLPPSILECVDGGCLVVLTALLSASAVNAPVDLHLEHMDVTLFALVVTLRAALVPAPPRWTAVVSGVAAIPLFISALVLMRQGRGVVAPRPPFLGVVLAAAWAIASTIAAWTISRVVYGLRVQVRSAMRFGRYTLEEKIGEGAMGSVYRARHATLRRPTALKLLSTSGGDRIGRKRFEREVQLTSGLTHPNTIAIYDYGHTRDGVFYYAMELLDGLTVEQLAEDEGPQPAGRVIHILSQAARALAEAHSIGLIHRDVKPANIFLCVYGGMHDFVKVLDFGLVKEIDSADPSLSAPNTIAGTPLYMAPETFANPGEIDARVDIYALGAVAYFLLTGHPPFESANMLALLHAHLMEAPRSPSERVERPVPHDLEALVLECLAKSPSDRPASAGELADRLDELRVAHPWSERDAKARWDARRRSAARTPASPFPAGPDAVAVAR